MKSNPILRCVVGGSLIVCANSVAAKESKPNILFICIDDMRTELGAYGNDYMITPNIDKLASEGRLFNHHYVQVPTSGPSRACMLTGVPVKKITDIDHEKLAKRLHGTAEGVTPESFVEHLKRSGYYTVGMGKFSHHGDGHVEYFDGNPRELPHSWDNFINDPNSPWEGHNLVPSYADGKSRESYPNNPPFEFLDRPDESFPDGQLANLALGEIERLAKEGGDRPFFMGVGFYKPHLPFCAPQKYWDLYDDEDVELSPNPDVPEGVSNVFLHHSVEFFKQYHHLEYGGLGVRLSDEYARDIRHAYFAAVSYTDAQVGKVMKKLKQTGLDKNTIVVVWGDHGWHLGDHTIWGKHSTFERSLNSTFMVRMPKQKQRGIATDALIATIDIYPTICDLAGVEKPKGLEGESFVKAIENPKAEGKEHVVSYWRNIISIRTERYRMSLFNNGTREEVMLFDHTTDPNETRNVSDKNPDVVAKLRESIKEVNNGFLPKL